MEFVEASHAQLDEITMLVQSSITRLCEPDHGNLPHNLQNWLPDRSKEKLAALLSIPGSTTIICINRDTIIGVSHITAEGKLNLCYVHPEHTGKGVGRKLLAHMETLAREAGLVKINLISTATAREFYLAQGYVQSSEPILQFGMPGYPMQKYL